MAEKAENLANGWVSANWLKTGKSAYPTADTNLRLATQLETSQGHQWNTNEPPNNRCTSEENLGEDWHKDIKKWPISIGDPPIPTPTDPQIRRNPCNRWGANQDQGPESIEGICHILVYLYILGGFLTNFHYFDTNSSKSI